MGSNIILIIIGAGFLSLGLMRERQGDEYSIPFMLVGIVSIIIGGLQLVQL